MNVASYSTTQPHPSIGIPIFQIRSGFVWGYGRCGIIFLLLSFAGCNGSDTSVVSHGGPVRDHVSLVDTLRGQGLTVEPTEPVSQPFFPVPGQTLKVNGEDIQVFEFQDASARKEQSEEISPDGISIGQTVVQWIDPPHFFATGKIIVLYLGSDTKLFQQLESALGQQIAGAQPSSNEKQ